jgi:hypothetical protein
VAYVNGYSNSKEENRYHEWTYQRPNKSTHLGRAALFVSKPLTNYHSYPAAETSATRQKTSESSLLAGPIKSVYNRCPKEAKRSNQCHDDNHYTHRGETMKKEVKPV